MHQKAIVKNQSNSVSLWALSRCIPAILRSTSYMSLTIVVKYGVRKGKKALPLNHTQ